MGESLSPRAGKSSPFARAKNENYAREEFYIRSFLDFFAVAVCIYTYIHRPRCIFGRLQF